ncbi:heme peroxidase [Stereum hirsutum FP-91666 SS1]|uniref:heme peroxidase n=1 Tax=Stereum hirsutum (strain FP-91666) TaxID=721885 RepID=UPI0004449EC1|nr:heme peroxidase [Stereum hirsutum FP-91666 SS1]EIM82504.1 heme peroxidase [Stereum hirsutum FP-91666 SS1]
MASITPLQAFSLGADERYLSSRPLPISPDGHYDWQVGVDANMRPEGHSGVSNIIKRVKSQVDKGFIRPNPAHVQGFLELAVNPEEEDDRKGAFAAGLTVLSRLPPGDLIANKLTDTSVGMLYNTIPHPIASKLSPVHSWRQADGGGNNIQDPSVGQAGRPYARSVQGKWCLTPAALPDASLVYDTLFKRSAKHPEHPGGNSSLVFHFATIVTHSLFRSDPRNWEVNNTSSYLDLSPVYGINQDAQDKVRNKSLGRGLLYPDTFSEERLLLLPPASSALLVILSRNHNFIAEKLLKINERGNWSDPPPEDEKKRAEQDEEIFQIARLVNGGHFMSLIMGDYVAGFLGLGEGNAWNMDAFKEIKNKEGILVGRGQGNHVSVEFNVLYRWHPTMSKEDERWTEESFNKVFHNKPFGELTTGDFLTAFKEIVHGLEPDPSKRTFDGLKRGDDGKFSDDDIANILQTATATPACSYGAQGTPECMKVIEVMGLEQARKWGVCTMNEFRRYLGLKAFASFEEWNPDPVIASGARRLYGHIDNLELYTGIQCEALMPLTPGLRFAAGYTLTRAVLGDAIALIRGDRFYTTDFTPANLTAWGFTDTLRDPNNGGFGGKLPQLLTRHLPRHYPFNSVYSCFPFFTPQKMKQTLTRMEIAQNYTFDRPQPAPVTKVLNTFAAIKKVFGDPKSFPNMYDMKGLGPGYGFMLAFDDNPKHDSDRTMALHALFPSKDSLDQYRAFYRDGVTKRIKERSWKYPNVEGTYIDIVTQVINSVSVEWAADHLCGIPLKTKENVSGLYTEAEIYEMFADLFQLAFLAFGDNENGASLRWRSTQCGGVISAMIAKALLGVAPGTASNTLVSVVATVASYFNAPPDKPYVAFLRKLAESGKGINAVIANVIGLAIGSSVNYAQAAVHVVDFYLDDAHAKEREVIIKLAQKGDSDVGSLQLLRGYVREAMRLHPQFVGLWRKSAVSTRIQQGSGYPDIEVKPDDIIFASFKNAHRNPDDFPNPMNIDPSRNKTSYNLNGCGFHGCPGVTYAEQTIAEIVKVVFKLKNVRRAAGNAGKLQSFVDIVNETETSVYMSPNGTLSPWPGAMHLVYDA